MTSTSLTRLRRGRHAAGLWVAPAYAERGYEEALPDVWVRPEVAGALERAAAALAAEGHGLLVWDGWRPADLQARLHGEYRAALAASSGLEGAALDDLVSGFVSPPDRTDPPPAHGTGGAVDVTLCAPATGAPLDMGGSFDELTERSDPGFYEREGLGPGERAFRDRRRALDAALREAGFVRLPTEWWHFELGTALWSEATGEPAPFDRIPGPGGRA